jgi:hypothetical protein
VTDEEAIEDALNFLRELGFHPELDGHGKVWFSTEEALDFNALVRPFLDYELPWAMD